MSNIKFDEMYKSMNTKELTALAKELGVPRYYTLNKKELVWSDPKKLDLG